MVTRFYRKVEIDLADCIKHIEHGYRLHTHYIVEAKEKQNVLTSNRFDREKN